MSIDYQLIEVPFASPICDEFLSLRYDALRAPLKMEFYEEDIEQEWNEYHLVCLDRRDHLMGGLLLRVISSTTVKMRQVAVQKLLRGEGIGKRLVKYSEVFALQNGFSIMSLHARANIHEFYLKLGYQIEGELFEEVGIPHYKMVKLLDK